MWLIELNTLLKYPFLLIIIYKLFIDVREVKTRFKLLIKQIDTEKKPLLRFKCNNFVYHINFHRHSPFATFDILPRLAIRLQTQIDLELCVHYL
jgi:hypothetical protein